MRSNIYENITVSYSANNEKTWDREKLQDYLTSHIVEKILAIPPRTEVSDKVT